MPAVVICPINRKGGVGKSSSCLHLGGFFASQGLKVLLIDNEPKHSLTNAFIGPDAAEEQPPEKTAASLFEPMSKASPTALIHKTSFDRIDIVYGSNALDQFNGPPENAPVESQFVIKQFVDQVKGQYDFVLIDSPPNLQLCSYAALAACNFTYCITQLQDFDLQGLKPVQQTIDTVMRTTNPTLRFAGYILNMVQSNVALHQAYEELLRNTYGSKVFKTRIPQWIDFVYAVTDRKPISYYKPNSDAAKVIQTLGRELIDRMTELHAKPPEFQFGGYRPKLGKTLTKQPEEAA